MAITAAHRANSSQTMKTVGSMVISDYPEGMMKPWDRPGNRENDTSVDDSVNLDIEFLDAVPQAALRNPQVFGGACLHPMTLR